MTELEAPTRPSRLPGGATVSVRVLLADGQALVRAGFRMILEAEPDIQVVGEAADGDQAVQAARRLRPDVVLIDARMPVLDGVEATHRLVAGGSGVRVLILTTADRDEDVDAAIRAGASGFLLKDVRPGQLVEAAAWSPAAARCWPRRSPAGCWSAWHGRCQPAASSRRRTL